MCKIENERSILDVSWSSWEKLETVSRHTPINKWHPAIRLQEVEIFGEPKPEVQGQNELLPGA